MNRYLTIDKVIEKLKTCPVERWEIKSRGKLHNYTDITASRNLAKLKVELSYYEQESMGHKSFSLELIEHYKSIASFREDYSDGGPIREFWEKSRIRKPIEMEECLLEKILDKWVTEVPFDENESRPKYYPLLSMYSWPSKIEIRTYGVFKGRYYAIREEKIPIDSSIGVDVDITKNSVYRIKRSVEIPLGSLSSTMFERLHQKIEQTFIVDSEPLNEKPEKKGHGKEITTNL